MRTFAPDPRTLRAARVLLAGGLVGMPTETVYGLSANALNPDAVARIFEAKGRPRFDPLIVHAFDAQHARLYVTSWPEAAQKLAAKFWPGPLTLVLPKSAEVPDIVTAGLPSVAIRVPDHPVALDLIRAAGVPVAAPSANRFGGVSPTTADHVRDELGSDVDVILDGGPCLRGVESTVISLLGVPERPPLLLRPGAAPLEEIEAIVGKLALPTSNSSSAAGQTDAAESARLSPGMLDRHYAPRTMMRLVDAPALSPTQGKHVGLISLRQRSMEGGFAAVEVLSPNRPGDLREAATNLFAAMRRLDAMGLDFILAERVPDEGLGRAINDRLRRASAKE